MKTVAQIERMGRESVGEKGFVVDTTFVLFFLAVEFGQMIGSFGLDTVVFAIALMMMTVMPYFISADEKPAFGPWLVGRTMIASFAVVLGAFFKMSLGILPEMFRFLPMTLLIVTAMLSCYIQFYGLLKLRTVK